MTWNPQTPGGVVHEGQLRIAMRRKCRPVSVNGPALRMRSWRGFVILVPFCPYEAISGYGVKK